MAFRYYYHVVALLSIPLAEAVSWAVVRARALRTSSPGSPGSPAVPQTAVWRSAVTIVAAVGVLAGTVWTAYRTYTEGRAVKIAWREVENYAQMNTPEQWAIDAAHAWATVLKPDEAISHTWAGWPAVYTDQTVIDYHGLNDRYVSRQPPAVRTAPGHEKFAPKEYLLSRNVVLVSPWTRSEN